MSRAKILLDCNALDKIQNNTEFIQQISSKYHFHVCATVVEELANIPDEKCDIRVRLFLTLCELSCTFIKDGCFVLGKSRLSCGRFSDGIVYEKFLNKNRLNICDSIIAQTAFIDDMTVLTDDIRFYNKLKENGINALSFKELMVKEDAAHE